MGTGLGGDWNALNYASDPLFQLLKGKHSPPSTRPHTCAFVPLVIVRQRLEHNHWEHSVPSEEPDAPPQRLAPGQWDWDLGAQPHALFTEDSPTV